MYKNDCRGRPQTNVYWVHMPRNIPLPPELPPPEDGNGSIASSSLTNPEVYDEPLNASANSESKYLYF